MHSILLLALNIFGLTVFVALLGAAHGGWKMAWEAWWQFTAYLLGMGAIGAVVWGWFMIFGP